VMEYWVEKIGFSITPTLQYSNIPVSTVSKPPGVGSVLL